MSRSSPPSMESFSKDADDGQWDLEKLEEKTIQPTQWGSVGSKMYKAYPSTHTKLPAGAYSVTLDRNDDRPVFIKKTMKTDDIVRFFDSWADRILSEIDTFWGKGDVFKEVGFLHRRGYLLYGPQGTGKSSIVQQIVEDVIKRQGVVLICENPRFFNMGLTVLRQAEPDRQLVCIFEDIDAIIKRYGEDELLSVLDGANMVDKVLNIATTNYPEELDRRIISRPRRFDRILKIDNPSEVMRREFLKMRLPKGQKLELWVKGTDGMSFAAVSEAIISVLCLGNAFDDTIKILKNIEEGHPSSEEFKNSKLGFSGSSNETD